MNMEHYMLPCPNKLLFGVECFGCGAQRAFLMVLEGQFTEAFHLFPAIYSIIPFLFFSAAALFDKKRNYSNILVSLGILNAVVVVAAYFLKHF